MTTDITLDQLIALIEKDFPFHEDWIWLLRSETTGGYFANLVKGIAPRYEMSFPTHATTKLAALRDAYMKALEVREVAQG